MLVQGVHYLHHMELVPPVPKSKKESLAYYRIANHYKFILQTFFDCFQFQRLIILEVTAQQGESETLDCMVSCIMLLGQVHAGASAIDCMAPTPQLLLLLLWQRTLRGLCSQDCAGTHAAGSGPGSVLAAAAEVPADVQGCPAA